MARNGIFLLFFSVSCISAPAQADWKAPREALDQRRVTGDFRIHYTLDGANAFPYGATPESRNEKTNAQLDHLAEQLARADNFYSKVLGLTRPLAGERYQAAHAIDVHIIDLGAKMGEAGDA